MAANPVHAPITNYGARDTANKPVTGVQVPGTGNVALKGAPVQNDGTDNFAPAIVRDATGTFAVAAAGNGYQVATFLARVIVTTAGTAALTIYDNAGPAGTATGKVIGAVPANATLGQMFDIRMPVTAGGISVVGGLGSPAVTVAYD